MQVTDKQLDGIKEILNIGFGRSASVLYKVVKKKVVLKVPVIKVVTLSEAINALNKGNENELSVVSIIFHGEIKGKLQLIFSTENAKTLVDYITPKNHAVREIPDFFPGTMTEIGNIVLNALIGSIGNILQTRFKYNIPNYVECTSENLTSDYNSDINHFILAESNFVIKNINVEGSILIMFEEGSFEQLINLVTESFDYT
jgi:chemotaxis protein CheC